MKYLSAAVPPCPGTIKSIYDDFIVEEIPLYPFSGAGDHTLVEIEKSGISTFEALRRMCVALSFPERDVGFACRREGCARAHPPAVLLEHCPP